MGPAFLHDGLHDRCLRMLAWTIVSLYSRVGTMPTIAMASAVVAIRDLATEPVHPQNAGLQTRHDELARSLRDAFASREARLSERSTS